MLQMCLESQIRVFFFFFFFGFQTILILLQCVLLTTVTTTTTTTTWTREMRTGGSRRLRHISTPRYITVFLILFFRVILYPCQTLDGPSVVEQYICGMYSISTCYNTSGLYSLSEIIYILEYYCKLLWMGFPDVSITLLPVLTRHTRNNCRVTG